MRPSSNTTKKKKNSSPMHVTGEFEEKIQRKKTVIQENLPACLKHKKMY
jgi:hypothetical protein